MRNPAKEAIVGEIYNDLLDNGFRAVGVLPIPVCTGQEAMDDGPTWVKERRCVILATDMNTQSSLLPSFIRMREYISLSIHLSTLPYLTYSYYGPEKLIY